MLEAAALDSIPELIMITSNISEGIHQEQCVVVRHGSNFFLAASFQSVISSGRVVVAVCTQIQIGSASITSAKFPGQ